jgi:hypothetical protein
MMDVKNLLRASLPLMAIGIALVMVSVALQVLALVLAGPSDILVTLPVLGETSVPDLASTVFTYLLYPAFFALYFWGGMRGVKAYRLDTLGSAGAAAVAYVATGFLHLALGILLNLLAINGILHTVRYSSVESTLSTALFGETAGAMGIVLSGVCGAGVLLIGALMTFVVGGLGAMFAQR